MGHTLAAAGGIEAAVCCKVIKTGTIPPTVNLENQDVEDGCDLDYTPLKAVKVDRVRAAISDNLGFGGHNAALVFKEYVKA
jgi:3-oxoacyl-[acyl-carrier-protein] synthase II